MISPSICKEWIKNPTINPRTHRKISPQGKIYKNFEKDCNKTLKMRRLPSDDMRRVPLRVERVCEEWFKNPNINPRTKRRIKNNGLVYKNLKIECGDKQKRKSLGAKGKVYKIIDDNDEIIDKIIDNDEIIDNDDNDEIIDNDDENGDYKSRIIIGNRVIQNLNEINADQWTMCMTGSSSSKFKNYFKDVIEIGKGTFGQIYLTTLNTEKIIVKEANLSRLEENILRKNVFLKDKSLEELIEKKKKNIFPREHKNLSYVNELLLSKKCPNFLYTYKMSLCDGCKVVGLFTKKPSVRACYVTFMEPADFDLASINKRININQQFSIFYQLLCSVYSIHHYYAMYHTDIKSRNILVKRIKPGGCFKYVIGDKTYYIENTGLLVFLADFGVAHSLSPKYDSLGFYGTRNAEVVESGQRPLWSPFETKYFADYGNLTRPKLSKPIYIKWIDNRSSTIRVIPGTFNKFGKTKIFPNISIDLYDNRRFPCFEFFNDIQDTIRTFIGGKQMFQDGTHPGMSNLHKDFKTTLEIFGFLKYQENMYYIKGSVKYVLAEEMLRDLYKEPQKIDYIIDTYYL
jgi:hypothetical protein